MAAKKKKSAKRTTKKRTTTRRRDDAVPQPTDSRGRLSVLIELRQAPGGSGAMAMGMASGFSIPGFQLDQEFEPVTLGGEVTSDGMSLSSTPESFVVRGTVRNERDMDALRSQPEVAGVWRDTPIAPFEDLDEPHPDPQENPGMAGCPIPPCDCSPGTPKGTMADVANYLGVNQIWSRGIRGTGMVVGVLDSGITAQGRPVKSGETSRRIPRVIGGWPSDWGTESGKWGNHGNMCATDVLGMAPDAQLYDLRIAGSGGSPGTISRALQAFQWAINRHRVDGTPQVLTNSWGIFQESWDATYARNPNHPFTRKVVEAINEGILVLFAAGNCGDTCPDSRCGSDTGTGKSIWGANGHPLVMTVGAVNKNEEFIGYSSRGPAALDPNKPDFCSISHFTGYFTSDSGTSAATPILAGVVALLKQAKSSATQAQIKAVLRATAKDIGPSGFDIHSGAGIVQGKSAFDRLTLPPRISIPRVRCPRITLTGPRCPRRTVVGPRCPRPSLPGTLCPRPTLVGPRCPRPTVVGPRCPRPTLAGPRCPRPTVVGPRCPRPTLAGPRCPRPTTIGCPRPTGARCPRPTLACPRVTMACGLDWDYGYDEDYYWSDESAYLPEDYMEEDYGYEDYELSEEGYYGDEDYWYDPDEYDDYDE